MNKTGKILTAGALLVGASTLSHCNGITEKDTKKNLVEVLGKDSVKDDNNTACFLVDQFTEKANDSAETKDTCFHVSISDLKGTPFYGPTRMITPNYGNFLGYSQAQTIVNDYNKGHKPILVSDLVSEDETLSIPFIYPELKSYFPDNWTDLTTMFPEYKDISENNLIFMARCDNGKSALAYYKNGKLTLATYVSLGNPHFRRAIRTTSGIFTLKKSIERRRSRAYNRSPMPYSIHVEGAGNGGVFLHQGKVDGSNLSHGCCRVPGLYQQYLYKNLPEFSKGIFHDLYNPTLRKH